MLLLELTHLSTLITTGVLLFSTETTLEISARGLDIAIASRFNSDHLYSTIIPKVSKSDGPAGFAARAVPASMMTLPGGSDELLRICNGWSWKLPFALLGVQNAFKFSLGDGKIFDFISVITDEAWGGNAGSSSYGPAYGPGNHSWTEGYEVTYAAENSSGISQVTIVIPEIQVVVVVDVQRTCISGQDNFAPLGPGQGDNNFAVYLADGKKMTFNSHGMISAITDMAGKNSLTYSYVSDARGGQTVDSKSRNTFEIATADYNAVLPGDLIIINDEIKVVFSKNGTDSYGGWISTSCNFDIVIPTKAQGSSTYTILKGQLQEITHRDGRAVKFYYYPISGSNTVMTILLSQDPTMDNFVQGDEFLGFYTFNAQNQLISYQTCSDLQHASKTGGFAADLQANTSSYFGIMQTVTYAYTLTNDPSPSTDTIVVTNNVGAPTIYYFQAGGFCSHSWNNAFFHRGSCRRGGSTTVLNIERPDFYINPNNPSQGTYGYANINRINQQAFYQASKADYQKDENAYDFNSENEFNTQMFMAQEAVSAVGIASGFLPGGNLLGAISGVITGVAGMALSADQFAHTQAKYAQDRQIAANAPPVSIWVPISQVTSPNRIVLGPPQHLLCLQGKTMYMRY